MSLAHATATILAKELRTEFRSRELLGTTIVFVLIVIVLFSFTFNPTSSESRRFGPGLLWLAFLFAGSLMLQPSLLRDPSELSPVWLTFLTSFDVVFLTAAWLFGEYLLEE